MFEHQFMEFLTRLAPQKEEMAVFRASIIDYWQNKHNELNTDIATIDRNIEKVEEEKVTLLRLSRNELQIEEFDVEASVNYCLYFMVNVCKL